MIFLLWANLSAPAAPNLTASLDRDVVTLGETATFTVTFEDLAPPGAPTLPPIPGVTVGGVSSSREFSFVNGQQTARQSYTYTLVPTQVGEVTIPPIQAQSQGKVFSTQPLKLRVVQGAAPGTPDPTIGKMAFLQLQVPKTEMYLGEALPVDIMLYVTTGNNPRMPQLNAEGFTVGKMVQAGQTRTMRDGQIYTVLAVKTYAAPVRPGQLRLGPASMSVEIPKPNARRSIFGDIYDWRQVTLTADAKTINVSPLPTQNVPPDFNGTVGSYTMQVTAGPTNLAVGDPITLKVQITGRGLLEGLNLPSLAQWRDFKAYPPTAALDSKDPLGLSGTKSFEQVIIPQNHEIKVLPAFQLSFFDPERRMYRTLSSPAVPLTVRPTASAVPPVVTNAAPKQNTPPPDDIVHIKPRLDSVAMTGPPLLERPGFLAWQIVPVVGWLALLLARKRSEALANNPRLRRQRLVAHRIRDGLKQLRLQAEKHEPDLFFATLFRLLQEQLGERLDLPASAITEAVIDEHLRGRNLPAETLSGLHELFQICNQFRYAPMKSRQELTSLIPKLEALLEQLQKWKGKDEA